MALTKCPEGHLFSSRMYGHICPYCSKVVNLNESKNSGLDDPRGDYNDTTAFMGHYEVMNPVTGWLVCIEGPSKGRDYRILKEKNFIGRSDGMDIQILGDNKIVKRNHAIIVYEPKKRKTMLLPGDAQGLVYVNHETIYTPTELALHDTIEMGNSIFVFVPLCGDDFEWADLEKMLDNKDENDKDSNNSDTDSY